MSRLSRFGEALGLVAPKVRQYQQPLPAIQASSLPTWRYVNDDGDKFTGGFGATDVLWTDYWTLRERSSDLFERNLYARGLIRRLVTNEINTGLHLEATPEETVIGVEDEALSDWSEDVETRFSLWARDKRACDFYEQMTFGEVQALARMEALVAGDVLCVLMLDPRTQMPRVRLISGSVVQTPLGNGFAKNGNQIIHGVEVDRFGRHVAYWIHRREPGEMVGKPQRLPAYGSRSGRRVAWLAYGTEKRLEQTRGKPLLSLVLQSLKEIDRYRDSAQLKATLNAMLAIFVKRTEDKVTPSALTGGATRRGTVTTQDTTGTDREVRVSEFMPGLIVEHLQPGEEPQGFSSNGTDEKFGEFEEAIIQAVAWAHEVPPEILRLSFSHNYSASQAATNEYKLALNRWRADFSSAFAQPVYEDWLIQQVLTGRIEAPGFLEAIRDPLKYDIAGAWLSADWTGQIKPAVDAVKVVNAEILKIEAGLTTRARACRELTGLKYSRVVKQLKRENEMLAEANEPIAPPAPPQGSAPPANDDADPDDEDDAEGRGEDTSARTLVRIA